MVALALRPIGYTFADVYHGLSPFEAGRLCSSIVKARESQEE